VIAVSVELSLAATLPFSRAVRPRQGPHPPGTQLDSGGLREGFARAPVTKLTPGTQPPSYSRLAPILFGGVRK